MFVRSNNGFTFKHGNGKLRKLATNKYLHQIYLQKKNMIMKRWKKIENTLLAKNKYIPFIGYQQLLENEIIFGNKTVVIL